MGLKPGMTNNPAGRPKGVPNKINGELRAWILDLINSNKKVLKKDFEGLDAKDRLYLTEKLLKYVLPTLQSIEMREDLDMLTDAQLEELYQRILKKINPN